MFLGTPEGFAGHVLDSSSLMPRFLERSNNLRLLTG